MGTLHLPAEEIMKLNPSVTVDLARGTSELLTWQGLPQAMTLGAENQPMSRDDMSFRRFEASRTGVKDIYRVTASFVGSVVVGSRPVVNQAEFFLHVGDEQLTPDDFVDIARNFAGKAVPSVEQWRADSIVRDLGTSIINLSTGRNVLPGEFWEVADRPA